MYEKHPLDMPKLGSLLLDDDVRVLANIVKEHGLTKAMISKLTGISYENVIEIVKLLQSKGEIVERIEYFSKIRLYQPTKDGLYRAECELNSMYVDELKLYLTDQGYDKTSAREFYIDKFYEYYTIGKFNIDSLASDFEDWCALNDKNPGKSPIRKLKK